MGPLSSWWVWGVFLLLNKPLFGDELFFSQDTVSTQIKFIILFAGASISLLTSLPWSEWKTARTIKQTVSDGVISLDVYVKDK